VINSPEFTKAMRILEVTIPPITSKTALLIPYSSEDIVGLHFSYLLDLTISFVGRKFPNFRLGMKAETLIFPLEIVFVVGMGQAEVTPVEIKTSITHLPERPCVKSSQRSLRLRVSGDRVWSQKQEAYP